MSKIRDRQGFFEHRRFSEPPFYSGHVATGEELERRADAEVGRRARLRDRKLKMIRGELDEENRTTSRRQVASRITLPALKFMKEDER